LPEELNTQAALHRATLKGHVTKRHRLELPRLLKWLAREYPEHALALLRYGAYRPEQTVAANDNLAEDEVEAGLVMDTDSTDRIRPSIAEIARAAPMLKAEPVEYARRGKAGNVIASDKIEGAPADGETVRATCGTLIFDLTPGRSRNPDHGFLVEYARTDDGKPRQPSYRSTGPKGEAWPERGAAAVRAYLALSPAEPRKTGWRRPYSGADAIAPMYAPLPRSAESNRYGAAEGRALLQTLGVDGDVEFEDARLAARRTAEQLVSAIVSPPDQFDGVVHGQDDAPMPLPAPIDDDPRESVSHENAAILEEALAGGTFAEIGRILGASPTYAARAGKAALLSALQQLRGDNDNIKKEFAAA
jgi:hypothetical protein